MKQDIRDLFKNEELSKKKLPESHKEEFLEKLQKIKNKPPQRKKRVSFLRIAAFVVLLFSIGAYFQYGKNQKPSLEAQVEQIEKEYLKNIEKEWNAFVKNTDDQNLIDRYEQKLTSLDTSYKEISKQFKKATNNISILEELIKNLQRRLELLKNIQQHIQELNQKNKSYETIII
ncbi:MAG: hypothetical protein JXR05_00435 [Flavobacteriaceae bacterium]